MICSKYEKLMRCRGRNNKETDCALNIVNRSGKRFKKQFKGRCYNCGKIGNKGVEDESWIKIKTRDHQIGVRILGIMPTLKVNRLVDFAMFVVREDIVHRNVH